MSEQFEFLLDQLPNLLWGFPGRRPGGLVMTFILTAFAIGVGFIAAVVVALGHHSALGVVRFISRTYVRIIRGIPLVVLLVLLLQLLGTGVLGFELSTLSTALVTLVLYSSAYQADIIATGISSVPQQLLDDARLHGAGWMQLTRTVSLPHSLRSMQPALVGQLITVFKDTSVVVVLGVAELTTTARIALGGDVQNAPYWVAMYLLVGTIYFLVAFTVSQVIDRRTNGSPMKYSTSGAGSQASFRIET